MNKKGNMEKKPALPLLTVGIPVFNGARTIELTIKSLENALKFLDKKDMVEIVFCDNASTDETQDIIQNFIQQTNHVCTYFRQLNNVGFDANLDSVVKLSSATYVWFLGCGEAVKPDSINKLIDKLVNQDEYTNVLVDFDVFEEKQGKITDEKMFFFHDDILLEGKDNFQYIKYGMAVSINIVNRVKWLEISNLPLVVDGWCHVERILSMIANDERSRTLLLPSAYFTLYRDKDGWWTKPDNYLFALRYIIIIRHVIAAYFPLPFFKELEKKQTHMTFFNTLMQSKLNGLKVDKQIIFEMVGMFKKDVFFWVIILPGLLLPRFFLTFLRFIISNVRNYVKKNNS